jgi:MFS transporter, FHS family, glucose/mannose:H+ symporter
MDWVISTQLASTPTRHEHALTVVASLSFVLAGIVTTFLGPILPLLARHWQLSDTQSGYFFATEFLGSTLGVLISSILLPRRGYRFCLGLSYSLIAIGVTGLKAGDWRVALLGTLTFGIGLGIDLPSTNLLVSTLNPQRPASVLSVVNFCWGVGAVIAPFGLEIAEHWNNVSAFLVVLSALLFMSAVTLSLTPEGQSHAAHQASAPQPRISNWPFLLMLGAMFFLYVAVETSVGGWIATLAERATAGAGQPWVLAPAFFWAGLIIGRGSAPLMLKRVSERVLSLSGLAIACLGISVLILSSHRQWITVAGIAIGYGLAAVFPITVALLSRFPGIEKRIAGPMFALSGLGGAMMPWLVGTISTWSGSLHLAFTAPLVAGVVLIWLHMVANR